MFGREIHVGFVKKPKSSDSAESSENESYSPEAIADALSSTVERVGEVIVKAVLIYIAADTVRKVIVKSTKEG